MTEILWLFNLEPGDVCYISMCRLFMDKLAPVFNFCCLNEGEINQKQDKVSSKSSLVSKFAEIKFRDLLIFHQMAESASGTEILF